MPDTPQFLDAQGNPITSRQAATMVAPPELDANGEPLSDPERDRQIAEIEQNTARYRRLGVPTDELGKPTRPLTWSEWFADAIQNPSPGAVLAGDVAGMGAGMLGGKVSLPRRTSVGAPAVAETPSVPRMVAQGIIKKISGIDPDAMAMQQNAYELRATRMRLQAARSRNRIAAGQPETAAPQPAAPETPARRIVRPTAKADKLADSPITPDMEDMVNRMTGGADAPTPGNGTYREDVQIPPATSPAETPAAPSARQSRASGGRRSGGRVPTLTPEQTQAARDLTDAGYSLSEVTQILDDLNHGVSSDQALKRVQVSRELLKTDAFRQTPTLEEVMKANEVRNRRYSK